MAYPCIKYGGKECDGCGDCQANNEYYCPICGELLDDIVYVSTEGDVVGCDSCVGIKHPSEVFDDE